MKVLIFAGAKLTFNGTNTHPGTAKIKCAMLLNLLWSLMGIYQ